MKVMVCGSIGYGDINEIEKFYSKIKNQGFEVLTHIKEENMDYSDIEDFRSMKELSEKIVKHDLNYVEKADVLVVLGNYASYGTGIEMYIAKKAGKKIVLFAPNPIPSPWPIRFSDVVVKDENELFQILKNFKDK